MNVDQVKNLEDADTFFEEEGLNLPDDINNGNLMDYITASQLKIDEMGKKRITTVRANEIIGLTLIVKRAYTILSWYLDVPEMTEKEEV